jgi:putative transposase
MAYTDDLHSLSHTKWNCKYHIVFAPKYRRKAFFMKPGGWKLDKYFGSYVIGRG